MFDLHAILITVVAFIVLIGLMVIVHEFGHFAVAKLCRVRVEAFSFGFGPRLFGFKYGETDYKVCLLPLGGFVKMTGENPAEGDVASDPDAFTSHPRWQRMLIGLAGPVANFLLAFALMFFYFGVINEVISVKPQLEWVTPGSVADKAGFKPGDTIIGFDTFTNPDLGAVEMDYDDKAGQNVAVTVLRDGQTVSFSLPIPVGIDDPESNALGFPHVTDKTLTIREVVSGSPAAEAGLHAEDQILAVDGYRFHTLSPMVAYLSEGKGKPVALTVLTSKGAQETLVVHPHQQGNSWLIGIAAQDYGDVPTRRTPLSLQKAASLSTELCVTGSKMIGQMLGKLLSHQASVKQLSGPVGIAVAAGEAAETKDWKAKFFLASEISLNLGILNLLPFPILDGGMILFLLIESLIRRDINMRVKEYVYQAAFFLIIIFFAYVIFNDLSNLPIFARFRQ
jgi:regulator of sigma E protease